jgi:hypothetical protein
MHRAQLLSERFVYLYKMALYAYWGEKKNRFVDFLD